MAAAWGMDDATAGKKLDALDTDGDGSVSPDEFFEKGKGRPPRDKGRGLAPPAAASSPRRTLTGITPSLWTKWRLTGASTPRRRPRR